MKKKQALILALAVAAAVCAVGLLGYLTLNTIGHTGEQAVAQMSPEEREWLGRVARIHKAMGAEDVYAVLGDPTSELVVLAKWDGFGGSRLSQLRVYFADGHPRKVRWLKLGSFVYEKDL